MGRLTFSEGRGRQSSLEGIPAPLCASKGCRSSNHGTIYDRSFVRGGRALAGKLEENLVVVRRPLAGVRSRSKRAVSIEGNWGITVTAIACPIIVEYPCAWYAHRISLIVRIACHGTLAVTVATSPLRY